MTSKFFRFLGSIKLAVPLLVAIAAVLIGATFYESQVGSPTVQREIYKSVWFGALMFLLALNLAISTISRYPWRGSRKIGFALTHWGLVVIIAGSAAVIHLSTEGLLLVRTDGEPSNLVRVEGDLLEVVAADSPPQQTEVFIQPDGTVVPAKFGDFALQNYQANTIKTVQFSEGAAIANPAVRLQIHSDRMGQRLERWLAVAPAAYSQIEIGPAQLEIKSAQSDQQLEAFLQAPSEQALGRWGTLSLGATEQQIDVYTQQGKAIQLGQVTVLVQGFWPDFRLNAQNQPVTASQQLRNPAVQLAVSEGDRHETWFVFAQSGFEPIRTGVSDPPIELSVAYRIAPPAPAAYFRVVVSPQGDLFYAARSTQGFKAGELRLGEPVSPGWADFQITLAEQVKNAQLHRQVVAIAADAPFVEEASPALLVATPDGTTHWLPWGEPTEIQSETGNYFAAFSPRMLQLPFLVKLNDFIVERNEGSESVAMWTSQITLMDVHSGETVQRPVWMNHPTWYKGWKIAQASWNPGDLQQSTLQVKREPWWVTALTWLGSLLVVTGIGTMFYGPAVTKRLRQAAAKTGSAQPANSETTPDMPSTALS